MVIGWLLLRQAEIALHALGADPGTGSPESAGTGRPPSTADTAFYTGKVAAASFFAQTVLPRIAAERHTLEATDHTLMDLPEDAF